MIDTAPDDQLLERFGRWLRATRAAVEQLGPEGCAPGPSPECREGEDAASTGEAPAEFGLYRLVEEFTALRHEVKLQTKSARALDAQSEQLATSLKQAIEALRTVGPREAEAAWSAGKAFALTLAELDEALDRGRRQTEQAAAALRDGPRDELLERLDAFHRASWWRRLRHGGYFRELRAVVEREQRRPPRTALLEALVDGYRLIQKRLAQALAAEEIVRIPTENLPVDPRRMVVAEVVDVDDRPGGRVYDELRRGYTWKGRVLRDAEVRATRRASIEPDPIGN